MAPSFLPKIILNFLFFISYFLIITTNAQPTYMYQDCYEGVGSYSVLSNYKTNIDKAIIELAVSANTSYFSNYTIGFGQDKVNAMYYCRYDVSPQLCQRCVMSTSQNTSSCLFSVEGLIAYEECTLHYSNRSIFGVMDDLPQLYHYSTGVEGSSFVLLLRNTVTDLITSVTAEFRVSSRYFATTTAKYSSSETIYALGQCNPDITSFECKTCLQTVFHNFTSNHTGSDYAQIFSASCRLSYILTSEELSQPWEFAHAFETKHTTPTFLPPPQDFTPIKTPPFSPQDFRPRSPAGFSPQGFTSSTGTRGNAIGVIMMTTFFSSVKLLLKFLL